MLRRQALLLLTASPLLNGANFEWTGGIGNWGESANWKQGSVPSSNDDVTITAGEARLTADVDVASLLLLGGTISLATSDCGQAGWHGRGDKCYKLFPGAKSWKEAEYECQAHSSDSASQLASMPGQAHGQQTAGQQARGCAGGAGGPASAERSLASVPS